MGSRLNENPDKIYECFFVVAAPEDDKSEPRILSQFPSDFHDPGVMKELPKFCFPCDLSVPPTSPPKNKRYNSAGQLFTFVLTNIDNVQRFGFCRHPPGAKTCLCFFSYLPWFEIFYKILNTVAELKHSSQDETALKIVKQLYNTAIPEPKKLLTISVADNGKSTEMHFSTPDPKSLPRIPESRNFMEFFSAVNPTNMMILFVSILYERRILITSEKLSRLTACVHGAASLLFPLYWQHIYTPVLPAHLIDYCCAPMPFLVGVHSSFMKKVRQMPLDEVIILNVDTNQIEAPFDDFEELPTEAIRDLKKNLKNASASVGDGVARSFLKTLVYLFGSYKEGLTVTKMEKGENQIVFDREKFVQSRSVHLQPFLERSLTLQHFERFVDTRLERITNQQGYPDDVFEQQLEIEKQDGGSLSSKSRLRKELVGQLVDGRDRLNRTRKIVTAKAKQGMIQAHGSIRANPDAIKARLNRVSDQVTTLSHQVSQQVKTDEMKATLQKGFSKTKDIGKVGIAGVKSATKHATRTVKTRVKGSRDAEDIDTRSRMTVYGTGLDSDQFGYSTVRRPGTGSTPASPAESPVMGRGKGFPGEHGTRPLTELFPSPGIRHYKTIELSSPQEDDEYSDSTSVDDMDLMNDPALKQIIEKLSPDKPLDKSPSKLVRQGSEGPAPIPPPRRTRAKKVASHPAGETGILPRPVTSRRRSSQEGQLINIDDDSSSPTTTPPPRPPAKPVRTFPSPKGGVDSTDGSEPPLINITESPSPEKPNQRVSRLLKVLESDSSDDGSTEHLETKGTLKSSNSSPNLITYGEGQNQLDPMSSKPLAQQTSTPSLRSSGNITSSSSQNMFSDSFTPVVSSQVFSAQSLQPSPSPPSSASSPALNPFTDSFVPMSTAMPSTNTPVKKTSLPATLNSSIPLSTQPMVPSHAQQTMPPAFMSQVPLQPLQPVSIQRSKSEADTPKDPFADLVSLQLKATSPTWKK